MIGRDLNDCSGLPVMGNQYFVMWIYWYMRVSAMVIAHSNVMIWYP